MKMTNRIVILFFSVAILASCTNTTDQKTFFESGNLKAIERNLSDTIELSYFYDDTSSVVRMKKWSLLDTIIRAQYFSEEGKLFFDSKLVEKEVKIELDTSDIGINFIKPKYRYLSFVNDSDKVFTNKFDEFYYDLQRGNGLDVRLSLNDIDGSLVKGILFDEHYEIQEDSSLIITAEHTFVNYQIPL